MKVKTFWALKQPLCSHLHKITNEPFFYMAHASYDFDFSSFLGPKKSRISWLKPSNGPRNVFAPNQNHNGPRHVINRFINSYNFNFKLFFCCCNFKVIFQNCSGIFFVQIGTVPNYLYAIYKQLEDPGNLYGSRRIRIRKTAQIRHHFTYRYRIKSQNLQLLLFLLTVQKNCGNPSPQFFSSFW